MKRRSTIFLWLAFLLTVLVGAAPALPAAGVWQCRHASRVITSTAAAVPGAMPCHRGRLMAMPGMGRMACCAARIPARAHRPHLTAPVCHPTFTPLNAGSPAMTEPGRVSLPLLTAAFDAPSRGPACLAFVLLPLSLRQRPPPDTGLLRSCFASAHRLRGPPSA